MSGNAVAIPLHSSRHPWRYAESDATRDLRIDFMRGLVFVLLFTTHFRYQSWFALIAWERVGVVSSAEAFIILAGIVTGAVYGKKLKSEGPGPCNIKLFRRAWTLYKLAILVAGSVALLRLVPGLDTTALTSFTDPVSGRSYALYPPADNGVLTFFEVLLLKAVPDQFQVVGLYVVLFLLTPIIFSAIYRGRTGSLLVLSWAAYLINYFALEPEPGAAALRITGGQFEYAFPLMAWQLIFVHGVAAGYHKQRILRFFLTRTGHTLLGLCIVSSMLFAAFSLNHPLDTLPRWAVATFIPPDVFLQWYQSYFVKYNLGPGRLLNTLVLLISLFALLTAAWKPIERSLGWLFIPLGQESMYVFFVHIYLILLISNTPLPAMDNVWINTAIHAGMLLLCWAMVKTRFLFRWIPR
ncbi:OpgC domain-containing protein [Noviherbaspirillum sp. CPCC 100848]|uniref:OpgC domain-containing protein n=1 Tax=Noviherbaspirillum album TaxID=3080276 RepID=A0ABU6JE21_9BURK|nr:OpgC domain-containing protein [Noviherbaspirillum sp. CPCC 100848]MEC4721899.1 OpgC domain-containing protein [Noviherbaspirillum sp. CPCC 100848]